MVESQFCRHQVRRALHVRRCLRLTVRLFTSDHAIQLLFSHTNRLPCTCKWASFHIQMSFFQFLSVSFQMQPSLYAKVWQSRECQQEYISAWIVRMKMNNQISAYYKVRPVASAYFKPHMGHSSSLSNNAFLNMAHSAFIVKVEVYYNNLCLPFLTIAICSHSRTWRILSSTFALTPLRLRESRWA